MESLSLRTMREIAGSLDASISFDLRWRSAALDRLLDESHATVVAAVMRELRGTGWEAEVEVSYAHFGERGSIDVLGWHAASRSLLVLEVKTDFPSAEATLRKIDEKARLAAIIAADRFGWRAATVSRLLVFPARPTLRRRVARHARSWRLRCRSAVGWCAGGSAGRTGGCPASGLLQILARAMLSRRFARRIGFG